jgi:squalene-hopene/tetraprenyl-beta-curcumene cyclase
MVRALTVSAAIVACFASSAMAIDEAHKKQGEAMIAKSIAYLKTQQDAKTGGWSIPKEATQPQFPAITGLVINGMLMQPGVDIKDEAVAKGVKYILDSAKPDGGIYDTTLPTYNTAICLSALAKVERDDVKNAIKKAQDYLRNSQWGASEALGVGGKGGKEAPLLNGQPVDEKHPFYGGWGYGNRGRPDISNLQFAVQALHDTGVPSEDPAMKRAIIFLQRVQMDPRFNDQPYAKGSKQGGFIYATAENDKTIGQGQSFAGTIEETMDDGSKVSKLRCYASVTYAGFKSYIYAGLTPTDPRVMAARAWLSENYDLSQNPGIGNDGQYYFYLAMSRALDATGTPEIAVKSSGETKTRDWQNDLVDQLAKLQNEDGSFKSVKDRWMENNPVLITAYSLLALQHAVRD